MNKLTQVTKTQMLTGGLEHFTITGADIVPTASADSVDGTQEFKDFYEQARVQEQIIELFRSFANVVLVSELKAGGFTVAVEHNDAVDVALLQEKIRELGTVPFGDAVTKDLSNVVIAKVDYDLIP